MAPFKVTLFVSLKHNDDWAHELVVREEQFRPTCVPEEHPLEHYRDIITLFQNFFEPYASIIVVIYPVFYYEKAPLAVRLERVSKCFKVFWLYRIFVKAAISHIN